ncbi:hypothetical protein HF086_001516 [Spodoptera exigua]|uniref:Uncharacterized protein n=1 Tax=Spodoptera exigua TaxID=7107 RepID=A0A922SAA9_SPOEX|nr:hypothetical protein HF086_001516 [Spodoptera exigua]
MAAIEEKLYPNCDATVWLRSCEEEVSEPLEGVTTGEVPKWLRGTLLRNGPGSLKVGDMRFDHLFDSSALLHRFAIDDGHVTYQCRFLRTNTLKKNRAANRIIVSEFGTKSAPDPCHSIFDRVAAFFNPAEHMSDNAMISVYPFGDEVYAFTEGPIIHRVDTVTLDTLERKNMTKCVALVNHTSHPHVMPNGDVYNLGMSIVKGTIRHVVAKFPYTEKGDMFKSARIVASLKPRWTLNPSYMHTFGITENYFVIVEQPLSVSVPGLMRGLITNDKLVSSLQWNPGYETHIVLLSRSTGREVKRFRTESLFYLHIINTFERDGNLIVDICTYKDAKVIDAMYVKAIEVRKPYRYFYAISSDVDAENPGMVIKVDTNTGETKTWYEPNCYPSEPIFVPAPNAKDEDDGVLLSALVWGGDVTNTVAVLILDAKTMQELARSTFDTPSPAPKCLHGWFLPTNS